LGLAGQAKNQNVPFSAPADVRSSKKIRDSQHLLFDKGPMLLSDVNLVELGETLINWVNAHLGNPGLGGFRFNGHAGAL
jgi:hypothetical protein